ncbi:MAG: EF-Tu/IF-2/RF-3 family GTPase [Syntrophorhabdaceae bacterium]|nr:EF-Tu/IF-2/RF-3 family GTPase [Syntrophorhabdaceae bacterium]
MEEKEIGKVVRYFSKIGIAAIRITQGELKIGDKIRIKGSSTDFDQIVESMQIEHQFVEKAEAGNDVGIKVKEKVRENDKIYISK